MRVLGLDDRIVVMDVEATCDNHGLVPKSEMEIIEIGAVLVEIRTFTTISEFQSFVRPVRHPRLTGFCQALTSINQRDVDRAPVLPEVEPAFKAWMYGHGATAFGSWGDWDRKQMAQDCAFHRIPYPMPGRHVNLKLMFSAARDLKKKLGMADALREVGLELQGIHHRGIDDARNIARLLPHAMAAR